MILARGDFRLRSITRYGEVHETFAPCRPAVGSSRTMNAVTGKPQCQATRGHQNRVKIPYQNEHPALKKFSRRTQNPRTTQALQAIIPSTIAQQDGSINTTLSSYPAVTKTVWQTLCHKLLRQDDKVGSIEDCQISGDPAACEVACRRSTGNR